jgi:hypothetical protein
LKIIFYSPSFAFKTVENHLSLSPCTSVCPSVYLSTRLCVTRLKSRNQHKLDTLFFVCLLGVNASTYFGRYSPIFRRLCTDAMWCSYVRRMCVDYVQVAVQPQLARTGLRYSKVLSDNKCQVPIAVTMKIAVFWDLTPCSLA